MTIPDALATLELVSPISTAELKKAYRDGLMVWHPDRFTGHDGLKEKAQIKISRIDEAYALLDGLPQTEYPFVGSAQYEPVDTAKPSTPGPPKSLPLPEPWPNNDYADQHVDTLSLERDSSENDVPPAQSVNESVDGKTNASSDWGSDATIGVTLLILAVVIIVIIVLASKRPWNGSLDTQVIPVAASQQTSISELRAQAEAGDAEAQAHLGFVFAEGQGVPKDGLEAEKWYLKSANQGSARGQVNLGIMLMLGQGIPKDETEGIKWLLKAALQGNRNAQFLVGLNYALGHGVSKDDTEAANWYRKAADQGHAEAQFRLGLKYSLGQGVLKDEAEALNLFQMAAEQGYADAQGLLGAYYSSGERVPKDEAKAVQWYQKAADQGNDIAQYSLSYMYSEGLGVPKDDVLAYKWCLLSAAKGFALAQEGLKISERTLTPAQREEGQRMAREFKPTVTPPAR